MSRSKGVISAAVFVILTIALFFGAWQLFLRPAQEKRMYPCGHSSLVEKYSAEYSLPPELVYAIIRTESSFREDAVSSAGAKGLMQITDDTNDWIARVMGEKSWFDESEKSSNDGDSELFDPELNIRRGCFLVRYLLDEFGRVEEALAAYNAGIGRVRGWLADAELTDENGCLEVDKIPIAETKSYIGKVLAAETKYKKLYFETK